MMGGSLPRSDGHRRSIGVGAVPARGSSDPSYGVVLGVVAATFVALGVLFLFPYLQRHFRYPIGWGAPGYVAKAADVRGNGLVLSGTIRVGGSLLLAVLMSATGQSAFTLVAIVPAMLTAIAGLGAVAMVRGPFEMRPIWVPVIAFLAWAGFVRNYILNFHLDNLVNASLVLPAFAAAIVFASRRKGALAATILFMAARLAEGDGSAPRRGRRFRGIRPAHPAGRSSHRVAWGAGREDLSQVEGPVHREAARSGHVLFDAARGRWGDRRHPVQLPGTWGSRGPAV